MLLCEVLLCEVLLCGVVVELSGINDDVDEEVVEGISGADIVVEEEVSRADVVAAAVNEVVDSGVVI